MSEHNQLFFFFFGKTVQLSFESTCVGWNCCVSGLLLYMMFMFYVYCRYLFSKWCGIQKHHIIDKIHKYLKYSLVPPPGVQSVSKTWRNFLLYCLVNFFFYHKSHHSLGCLCLCVNYACVKCHGNKPTRSPSPLFSLGNRPFSSSGTNEQV